MTGLNYDAWSETALAFEKGGKNKAVTMCCRDAEEEKNIWRVPSTGIVQYNYCTVYTVLYMLLLLFWW